MQPFVMPVNRVQCASAYVCSDRACHCHLMALVCAITSRDTTHTVCVLHKNTVLRIHAIKEYKSTIVCDTASTYSRTIHTLHASNDEFNALHIFTRSIKKLKIYLLVATTAPILLKLSRISGGEQCEIIRNYVAHIFLV